MSPYQLLPWIDESKLTVSGLCRNTNPQAMHFIKNLLHKMTYDDWKNLSGRDYAKDLLIENMDKIDYGSLESNNLAYSSIIKHNPDRINWSILSRKEDEDAIELLENSLDRVDWRALSANRNAIRILANNLDRVDWTALSANKDAIGILEDNIYRVDWIALSANENAIGMLRAYPDKIDHAALLENKNPDAVDLIIVSRCRIIKSYVLHNFVLRFQGSERHARFIKKNLDMIYAKTDNASELYDIVNEDILRYVIAKAGPLNDRARLHLSINPVARNILDEDRSRIDWEGLCHNNSEWAYELLMENKDKIDYGLLCLTENPMFLDVLQENLDRLTDGDLQMLLETGDHSWKLKLLSNDEIMDRLFPLRNTDMPMETEGEDDKEPEWQVVFDFISRAKKREELEFMERWFNKDRYYGFISQCPSIFIGERYRGERPERA